MRVEEDRRRTVAETERRSEEETRGVGEKTGEAEQQREEFRKLQDEEGMKLDAIKRDIASGEDLARKLYGRNAAAERKVRCLLDQQVSAMADCNRIVEQRDGELQRLAEARVEGARKEEDRATRLWDLQD